MGVQQPKRPGRLWYLAFSGLMLAACLAPGEEETAVPYKAKPAPTAKPMVAPSPPLAPAPTALPAEYAVAFVDVPPCVRREVAGGLSIETGCAGDLCLGMTYAEAIAQAGEPSGCSTFEQSVSCTWATGVTLWFPDFDSDELPDGGFEADFMAVRAPFAGTTLSGLGIGVSMKCFVEAYGYPSSADLQPDSLIASWHDPSAVSFSALSFQASRLAPRGIVDTLYIGSAAQDRRTPCRTSADCPASRPKCAAVDNSFGARFMCMPQLGNKQLGEACVRPTSMRGVDDCDLDLYCSPFAGIQNARCQRLCQQPSDCGPSEACARMTGGAIGSCTPTCSIFAVDDGCPPGSTCRSYELWFGEQQICGELQGSGNRGDLCNDTGCGPRLSCTNADDGNYYCYQRCDAEHPCPEGLICGEPYVYGGLGYCEEGL